MMSCPANRYRTIALHYKSSTSYLTTGHYFKVQLNFKVIFRLLVTDPLRYLCMCKTGYLSDCKGHEFTTSQIDILCYTELSELLATGY